MSDSHSVPTQVNKAAAEVSLQIEKIYANKNFETGFRQESSCLLVVVHYFHWVFRISGRGLPHAGIRCCRFAGSGLTVGIAAELALFLLFLVISTIYVSFANGKFDPMLRHLVEKAGDGRAQ